MIQTDVCVAGAGAAGIAIATELAGSDVDVVLIESGGFEHDEETNALNVGRSEGLPYARLEACRSRYFGGSTNCWAGWARPFELEDLEQRSWVKDSGWPIRHTDLGGYWERAARMIGLGDMDFDPESWARRIAHPRGRFLSLDGGRITNQVLQFSPPARFGQLYRADLERAANIRCLLHANVVGLKTDADSRVVERVRVATLTGSTLEISARIVVLAMGGIENPRILLLPSLEAPEGLGNRYGLVGRYFMEHSSFHAGYLLPTPGGAPLDLYDATFSHHDGDFSVDGVSAAAYLSVDPKVRQEEGLLRDRTFLHTVFAGEGTLGTEALLRLAGRTPADRRSGSSRADAWMVARHWPRVVLGAVGRHFRIRALARSVRVLTIVEPEPTPESRIILGKETDALGVPRAVVSWYLTDNVRRTFVRVQQLLAEELSRFGVGTFVPVELPDPWTRDMRWCRHHIGTTRMASDPKRGVVDADCRVHGVANLYVAGSSVFPTAGSDLPTLTIVALALRTADHVRTRLAR